MFSLILLCLIFAGCSKDIQDVQYVQSNEQVLAPVTVRVSDFIVSQEDVPGTRATAVSSNNNLKFLTLAFYKGDGTEVYKHTQNRDDNTTFTTFGEFMTSLPYGSYTMVVIANGGNNAITLTSPTAATYGENNPKDTFAKTQEVNVTGNDAVELTATLDRIVAAVVVQSTDNRPAEVTHIRLTYTKGGKSFSPETGLATSNTGFVTTISYSGSAGSTTTVGGYLFLATDEQTTNVTIETLDAADGNVLFRKTIANVPLKRNRQTTLTGAIYTGTGVSAGSFQVNTDWLTGNNINF